MDRGAWGATVHIAAKSRTQLGDLLSLSVKSEGESFLDLPGDSAGKESPCNAGDLGSIPGLGRSPGEGKGYSLQYSGLENSIAHGVAKNNFFFF